MSPSQQHPTLHIISHNCTNVHTVRDDMNTEYSDENLRVPGENRLYCDTYRNARTLCVYGLNNKIM